MKIEEIETIVKLMSAHDLTEFKIEAESYNLCSFLLIKKY